MDKYTKELFHEWKIFYELDDGVNVYENDADEKLDWNEKMKIAFMLVDRWLVKHHIIQRVLFHEYRGSKRIHYKR